MESLQKSHNLENAFQIIPIYSLQSTVHLLNCVELFANPMDCSMRALPVHHQLLESTQTHVHCVGDAIHLILCRPLLPLP